MLTAGGNAGLFLTFSIGGWVGHHWGWRVAFAVAGLPPLMVAALLRLTTTEISRRAGASSIAAGSISLVAATLRQMGGDPVPRQALIAATLAMTVGYGAIAWIPSYLVRSHGLNIAQAGAYLAVVIGLGGAVGSWLGGRLSDRLRARDIRWSLWLTAVVFVVARPFAMAFYWVDDTKLALALFVLPAAAGSIHIGPCVALLHERVGARLRPVVSALFLMTLTLVGLGLGPLAVGAMSDFVFASHGENSLRYALFAWQLIGFWAAIHFFIAGNRLRPG